VIDGDSLGLMACTWPQDTFAEALALFLRAGGDVNSRNWQDAPLIFSALSHERPASCIAALLAVGVNVQCVYQNGCTPLHSGTYDEEVARSHAAPTPTRRTATGARPSIRLPVQVGLRA